MISFGKTAYAFSGSIETSTVSPEHIFAAFVVQLPFRLRLGSLYRESFSSRNRPVHLWVRNRVPVPDAAAAERVLEVTTENAELWSEALLVLEKPQVSETLLQDIRSHVDTGQAKNYPLPPSERNRAMVALNHFLMGYSTATRVSAGGRYLRPFRSQDFIEYVRRSFTLVGLRHDFVDDSFAVRLLDFLPEREARLTRWLVGDLSDLPPRALEGIGAAISRHQDHLFHEFAFEAKSKALADDYVGALLMAIAALEGVHGVYVTQSLARKLPPQGASQLSDDFIRELGFSRCNKITPYLFLPPELRPEPSLISRVATAVTYRNDIMHARRNKRGQYVARERTPGELSEAYSAVVEMFECYCAAYDELTREQPGETNEDGNA